MPTIVDNIMVMSLVAVRSLSLLAVVESHILVTTMVTCSIYVIRGIADISVFSQIR